MMLVIVVVVVIVAIVVFVISVIDPRKVPLKFGQNGGGVTDFQRTLRERGTKIK